MGSAITMSGFNKIDWGLILDAVMEQEQAPLRTLQAQQKTLESRAGTYSTLATKLSTFQTAVTTLSSASRLTGRTATNTDATLVNASASDGAVPGLYDVSVQSLARAQVTASTSFPPDADQTIVASSGNLVIGGVTVTIDAPVTLQGLADRINAATDIPVAATVVRSAPNMFQLVLTARATGAASAFSIDSTLAGAGAGGAITFGTTNAVDASDARVLVNNVEVTSSTNTISEAIHGVTLQLLREAPAATATISVSEDTTNATDAMKKLVDAYNDLVKFSEDQNLAASRGDGASIARDPLLRGLRTALRATLTAEYSIGGDYSALSAIGLGLDRTGRLTFKASAFEAALRDGRADVTALLTAEGVTPGVFPSLQSVLETYTSADGLLIDMKSRLDEQTTTLDHRIADLEERLAVRRRVLQQEYIAADQTMTQLNSQLGALSSLANQYSLF